MNNLKLKFMKYYLLILGFSMFFIYMWNRFFRERTVKDLPFNLSIMYFFTLVYLCSIFAFILFTMLKNTKKNDIVDIIVDWLFIPIKELEIFIRCNIIGKRYYESFIDFIYPYLNYVIIKTNIFYTIFWIFPRLLLLTALFIDVFVFHQMNYKYQVIFFGLLLLFNRLFKYSLKNLKEEYLNDFQIYVKEVVVNYQPYIHPSELAPDYNPEEDDNDEWPTTMCLPLNIYIKYNTESMVYENITRDIHFFLHTQKAREYFWEKYVEEPYVFYHQQRTPIPFNYKNKFGNKSPDNYYAADNMVYTKMVENAKLNIKKIMNISLLLEYLNKTSNIDYNIKILKILIYLNYLLCWLYVLIICMPTLNILALIIVLINTYTSIPEPFSNIII